MVNDQEIHAFMIVYQNRYGVPPLLAEIKKRFPSLNHRSSAFYAIHRLLRQNKIEVVGEPMTKRRYRAV